MNEKAKVRLVYVDQDYLDILRSVENKVSTKNRPYVFLGITINEHLYCIPLTSQTNRARARRGLRKRPNTFTENIIGPRGYVANLWCCDFKRLEECAC